MLAKNIKTIAINKRVNQPFSNGTTADLCFDILFNNGIADICENEIPYIPSDFALFEYFNRRNA